MNMNQILSAIRTFLMALSGYFIGMNFFGTDIDQPTWTLLVGILVGIVTVVWSIITKTVTDEMWQGLVRQAITLIGGILIARGVLTKELWETILALIVSLLPFIQSEQSRILAKKLQRGEVSPHALTSDK